MQREGFAGEGLSGRGCKSGLNREASLEQDGKRGEENIR